MPPDNTISSHVTSMQNKISGACNGLRRYYDLKSDFLFLKKETDNSLKEIWLEIEKINIELHKTESFDFGKFLIDMAFSVGFSVLASGISKAIVSRLTKPESPSTMTQISQYRSTEVAEFIRQSEQVAFSSNGLGYALSSDAQALIVQESVELNEILHQTSGSSGGSPLLQTGIRTIISTSLSEMKTQATSYAESAQGSYPSLNQLANYDQLKSSVNSVIALYFDLIRDFARSTKNPILLNILWGIIQPIEDDNPIEGNKKYSKLFTSYMTQLIEDYTKFIVFNGLKLYQIRPLPHSILDKLHVAGLIRDKKRAERVLKYFNFIRAEKSENPLGIIVLDCIVVKRVEPPYPDIHYLALRGLHFPKTHYYAIEPSQFENYLDPKHEKYTLGLILLERLDTSQKSGYAQLFNIVSEKAIEKTKQHFGGIPKFYKKDYDRAVHDIEIGKVWDYF